MNVHLLKVFRVGDLGAHQPGVYFTIGFPGPENLQTFFLPGPVDPRVMKILETCKGRVVLWLAAWPNCFSSKQFLFQSYQQPSPKPSCQPGEDFNLSGVKSCVRVVRGTSGRQGGLHVVVFKGLISPKSVHGCE